MKLLLSVLLALLLVSDGVFVEEEVNLEKFEAHIDYLVNDTLGFNLMKRRIKLLEFSKKKFDGHFIVNKLARTISEKVNIHIEALRRTKNVLEQTMSEHWVKKSSSWPSCCRYKAESTYFDLGFKTKIDDSDGCEIISDSSPRYVTSIPTEVLKVMKENRKNVPSLKWQYVGSEEGVFTLYPAVDKPNMCGGMNYDPRIRPWYVETASPSAKHVVIVLDSSFSMSQTHAGVELMEIAKTAIEKVMETLNPKDRVGIVAFNDTAYFPKNCYGQSLAVATPVNIATLKRDFLMKLQPGGQSNYAAGFEAAFKLMESSWNTSKEMKNIRPSPRSSYDCMLLFITDGDASEIKRKQTDAIFRAIRNGNGKIRNVAKIYAYGLGRKVNMDLLDTIVQQDFNGVLPAVNYSKNDRRPQTGYAYHIQDASLLRNNMSFFYHNFRKHNASKPSFSIPYFDATGLGLIFTTGFPLYVKKNNHSHLFGVVAIDIALDDLLENAIEFKKDSRSYVFVIDNTGRVLVHPLMPHPNHHLEAPSFIQIDALERDAAFYDVMHAMMNGSEGTLTFSSQRIAPAGDCNWVFNVNQTYYWKPIEGTSFSVCFVEEKTDYSAKMNPAQAVQCNYESHKMLFKTTLDPETQNFHYHRLDLMHKADVCRHFYQISTNTNSVVKFASSAFRNPIQYETLPETLSDVLDYDRFFNKLIKSTKKADAAKVLREEERVASVFLPDVISDVVWTTITEHLWFKGSEFDKHTIRRFIATPSGVMRFHPGTNLTETYDPTKRFWYELAVTRQGLLAFSPPYKDAAGAGNVITISQTLHAPSIQNKPRKKQTFAELDENKIIAVMGMDLSLDYLYYKMLDLYPKCQSQWACSLVNLRGYVVLDSDYLKVDAAKVQKHITGDDSPLALMLLETGDMFRAACLDLDSNDYKVSYVIKPHTFLNRMESPDICKRYYMKEIGNTNLFFVAQEYHKHCFKTACRKNQQACWQHHTCVDERILPEICECPCTTPLVVDTCINYIQYMKINVTDSNNKTASLDIPPCFPDRPQSGVSKSDCIPSHLRPCIDANCDRIYEKTKCSSVVGCSWCSKAKNGGTLEYPFCSDSDICYNGYQNATLPGFGNLQDSCDPESSKAVVLSVVLSLSCIAILIIIFIFASIYIRRNQNKKVADEDKSSKKYDEVATLSAALGIAKPRKHSLGSISTFKRASGANRLASISSQVSSQQKPPAASHQVVLSIVDSSGSEIARSQPRPVQIIHGNRPGSSAANIGAPMSPGSRESCMNSTTSGAGSGSSYMSARTALRTSQLSIADLAQRSTGRPGSRPISPLRRNTASINGSSKSAPSTPRGSNRRRQRPPSLTTGILSALKNISARNNDLSPKSLQSRNSMANLHEVENISTPFVEEVDSAYSEESVKTPYYPQYQSEEQFSDYVAVGMDGTITPAGPSLPSSPVHFNFENRIIGGNITWDSFDKAAESPTSTNSEGVPNENVPSSPNKTMFELPQYDEFSLNYIKSNMSALLSDLESASQSDNYEQSKNIKSRSRRKSNTSDFAENYAKINKKKRTSRDKSDSIDEGLAIYV